MGTSSWLKKKSYKKSAANIINALRPLIVAVREDLEGARGQLGQIAALGAVLEQDGELSQQELTDQMEAANSWRRRKIKVKKAQERLYQNVALWSSLSPERSFNEIILPALFSGQLIAPSEPCFEPIIVAIYRVCEAVAKQNGVNLEAHTPPQILQIVNDADNLYKGRTA
jgi:hypothetical protein